MFSSLVNHLIIAETISGILLTLGLIGLFGSVVGFLVVAHIRDEVGYNYENLRVHLRNIIISTVVSILVMVAATLPFFNKEYIVAKYAAKAADYYVEQNPEQLNNIASAIDGILQVFEELPTNINILVNKGVTE